jgi:hypothetical protein
MPTVKPLRFHRSGADVTGFSELQAGETIDKADVGLSNVDNTADANKPVSDPQATAIGLKQDKFVTAVLMDGATISCDISTGDVFDVTIAGNRTINFTGGSAALDGKKILIRVKQDATGSRLIIWGTGSRFGTDITSITLTTTASKTDIIGIIYHHVAVKYDIIAFARGY